MQGFFAAEGFAVVSASSNVVVELISIGIRAISGHCDASDRDHCEIVLGTVIVSCCIEYHHCIECSER